VRLTFGLKALVAILIGILAALTLALILGQSVSWSRLAKASGPSSRLESWRTH
jgi:hypothetical protein